MTPSTMSIKSNARIITSSITHHADRAGHVNKKPPNYFFLLLLTLLPPGYPPTIYARCTPSQVKFLLSTQIQNSPPLLPGAGSLLDRSQEAHSFFSAALRVSFGVLLCRDSSLRICFFSAFPALLLLLLRATLLVAALLVRVLLVACGYGPVPPFLKVPSLLLFLFCPCPSEPPPHSSFVGPFLIIMCCRLPSYPSQYS